MSCSQAHTAYVIVLIMLERNRWRCCHVIVHFERIIPIKFGLEPRDAKRETQAYSTVSSFYLYCCTVLSSYLGHQQPTHTREHPSHFQRLFRPHHASRQSPQPHTTTFCTLFSSFFVIPFHPFFFPPPRGLLNTTNKCHQEFFFGLCSL